MFFGKIAIVINFVIALSNGKKENFHFGNRIVGGRVEHISNFQYQVAIFMNRSFTCGGSIIAPKCILTAAHCFNNADPTKAIVRGGISRLNSKGGINRKVNEAFIPARYSKETNNMDIAILKLFKPITGFNTAVIELHDEPLEDGAAITLSGWGLIDEIAFEPSNDLRVVDVYVIGKQQCVDLYKRKTKLTGTMFCATGGNQTQDACSGDSGGPAVINGKQVGVVSWGLGCARKEFPGVYTGVSKKEKWLKRNILKHCKKKKV